MSNFLEVAEGLQRSGKIESFYESAFKDVFEAQTELQSVHSKAQLDLHNIESVFGAFEMAKRFRKPFGNLQYEQIEKLGGQMRLLIARTLELTSDFHWRQRIETQNAIRVQVPYLVPPYPYGDFAQLIKRLLEKTQVTILTFNYDIGIDAALAFENLAVDYCLQKELLTGSRIPLIKLHGSINWGRCRNADCNNEVVPWRFEEFYKSNPPKNYNTDPYGYRSGAEDVNVKIATAIPRHRHSCGTTLQMGCPAIVPPTWEKAEYNTGFENMWAHAAKQLAEAENIIVIGYSLPPSDQFFPMLYALGTVSRTIVKRFWVFDPDPLGLVERQFQGILGSATIQRFLRQQSRFSDAFGKLEEFARGL